MNSLHDIMVVGDVHADFGALNTLLNKKRPKIVLQCGDFGFWPNMKAKDRRNRWRERKAPIAKDTRLYWADGNHEDHWSLKARQTNEVYPNVFHMKRGATLTLPDSCHAALFRRKSGDVFDRMLHLAGRGVRWAA
jgi:hypothetical protein